MKRLIFCFLSLAAFTATPNLKASSQMWRAAVSSMFPLIGHLLAAQDYHFYKSTLSNDQKAKEVVTGMVLGTAAWLGLTQFFKSNFREGSWYPYLLVSLPPALLVALFQIQMRLKR